MIENQSKSEQELVIDWAELAGVLWRARRFLLKWSFIFALGISGISLLMSNYYNSTAVLLPSVEESPSSTLSGLSSLANLAGVSVGSSNPEVLYPSILTSESILRDIISSRYPWGYEGDSAGVIEYYDIEEDSDEEDYEVALEALRKDLSVDVDKETYLVTIGIETTDPVFSASIVNALVEKLDNFLQTKRRTTASEQRKWIDSRLEEVRQDLSKSEDALKIFRESNRRVLDSPELLLEEERLKREVLINTQLYAELKKQYEITRIEEIKTVPVINAMDMGRPAAEKSRPRRSVVVILGTFVFFLLLSGYIIIDHYRFSSIAEFYESVTGSKFPISSIEGVWTQKQGKKDEQADHEETT